MRLLIAPSIQHRWIVALLATITMVFGLESLIRTPLDVFPEFVPPQVSVQTEAVGWSPEQVEQRVTTPIETSLSGAVGIVSMRSESIAELSVVNLNFADDADLYTVRQGIAERLSEVATRLPAGIAAPKMSPLTSSTMDVLKLGLQSKRLDAFALRELAEWTLKPRLLAVPGVARVTLFGGKVRQWQVQIDPARLDATGMTLSEVLGAVSRALDVRGGGSIELDAQRIPIVLAASNTPQATIASTVLRVDQGVSLRLRDVAEVVSAAAVPIGDTLIQGEPGVLLTVSGQYASNTLEVTRAIEAVLTTLRPQLAAQDVTLITPLHRPANFIERALKDLGQALAIGSLLILITLFVFLRNWRTVAISFVTIPLSLLAAIMVLDYRGETLNTLTLGGFAVALGVLVDDAIIGIENVVRRLHLNATSSAPRPRLQIVLDATLEIRAPVFYATLVVVLVFLPVLALSGVQGRLLTPMAAAFVWSVLASLVVALTVTPALCAFLLRDPEADHEPRWWRQMRDGHQRGMRWVDAHLSVVMIALVVALGLAVALLPQLRGEFFPMFREGHFVMQVSARQPGTSITEMLRVGESISAEVLRLPYIASIEQQIGRAEQGEDTWGTHRSEFHVALKADADVDQAEAQRALRRILARYPAVQSEVMTFLGDRISETMTGETSAVVINIIGPDLDALDRIAAQVAAQARPIRGVVDLKSGASAAAAQLVVRTRPDALALHGVQAHDVAEAIATAFAGITVGQIHEHDHATDVVVTLPDAFRHQPERIGDLPLTALDGRRLRVRDVAFIEAGSGRSTVQHDAGRRRAVVAFNVVGQRADTVIAELRDRLTARVTLPPGVFVEFSGVAEAERTVHRELAVYGVLALALILLCLGLTFRRASDVAMVLLNLPFALIGGVAAIAVTGVGLSIGALVGLITVFGISARNAILLLAHYDHLRTVEGEDWTPTVVWRGASERLRPVLMTALVTALGLVPLALGAGKPGHEIEAPMAIAVLGGLLTSTLLTLLVLPAIARRRNYPIAIQPT